MTEKHHLEMFSYYDCDFVNSLSVLYLSFLTKVKGYGSNVTLESFMNALTHHWLNCLLPSTGGLSSYVSCQLLVLNIAHEILGPTGDFILAILLHVSGR